MSKELLSSSAKLIEEWGDIIAYIGSLQVDEGLSEKVIRQSFKD